MGASTKQTQEDRHQRSTIEFDEYVAEVSGSTSTTVPTVTGYSFNPGLATLFPNGSKEAAVWTEWKLKYARPYYKHKVSAFATNGQSGKVILAFDYNAKNSAPTTVQQLEVFATRADAMPCEDIEINLRSDLINKSDSKYIRTGAIPAGSDPRVMDGGTLYVATVGNQATSNVGELRIKYCFDVFLQTNVQSSGAAPSNSNAAWFQSTTAEASGGTTVPTTMLLATASQNQLGAVNTAGSIVPPLGNYLFDADVVMNNTSSVNTTLTLDFQKNGASLFLVARTVQAVTTGGATQLALHLSGYVACNGSDALKVIATSIFGVGTVTNSGSLRLVAV